MGNASLPVVETNLVTSPNTVYIYNRPPYPCELGSRLKSRMISSITRKAYQPPYLPGQHPHDSTDPLLDTTIYRCAVHTTLNRLAPLVGLWFSKAREANRWRRYFPTTEVEVHLLRS